MDATIYIICDTSGSRRKVLYSDLRRAFQVSSFIRSRILDDLTTFPRKAKAFNNLLDVAYVRDKLETLQPAFGGDVFYHFPSLAVHISILVQLFGRNTHTALNFGKVSQA